LYITWFNKLLKNNIITKQEYEKSY
jgi:hypothetical protein